MTPKRYRLGIPRAKTRLDFLYAVRWEKGRRVPLHAHNVLEIVYYGEGRGHTAVDGTPLSFGPRSYAIIPAGISHDHVHRGVLRAFCMGLASSGLEDLKGCWRDDDEHLGRAIERLLQELDRREPAYADVAGGLVMQVTGLARRLAEKRPAKPRKEELVSRALNIIRDREGAVTVGDLSSCLYVSPDYLRHLFQDYASGSPMRHIIDARIEKAKRLLAQPGLTIAEIAVQSGIENPYYFSRLFKKATGRTPSAFRTEEAQRKPMA